MTFRGLDGAFFGAERLSGPALMWLRAPIDSDVGLLSGLFSTSKVRVSRGLLYYSVWAIRAGIDPKLTTVLTFTIFSVSSRLGGGAE